jgi:three-Cys-motif partner protein
MTPVDSTIWPLDPHGRAKHYILRRHLEGWLPIMTRTFARLVYIDGFAGPGVYTGGEPGSPIIALRAAAFHRQLVNMPPACELWFVFIEERGDRVDRLTEEVKKLISQEPLPSWVKYFVIKGEFHEVMQRNLDRISLHGKRPLLAFIDPFGYSGLPMSLLARISKVRHSECLINFTLKSLRRWGKDPRKHPTIDALYGGPIWRPYIANEEAMMELYRKQIVAAGGFRYSCIFKMKDRGNVTEYILVFATNDPKGLTVMKRAMWSTDPLSGGLFKDRTDEGQSWLSIDSMALRELLRREFRGRGWVAIDAVEEFVRHTPYSEEIHLRNRTLVPMARERPAALEVQRPVGKHSGFTPGTRLRFI